MARRGRGRSRSNRSHPYPCREPKEELEQQPSSQAYWGILPLEIRNMVFEYLEDSIQSGNAKAFMYTSVCKDWYAYFEPYIFRRLTLSIERLNELDAMITGSRRRFVQHIWLRFERSVQPGVKPVKFRHGMDALRFVAAIFQLFQILSEWPERIAGQPGITLELTAFSTADPDYSMKDTVPDELKDVDLTVDSETLDAIYDKAPSVRRALIEQDIRQQYELQEFYDPQMHFASTSVRVPVVGLITDLTIRRQMHISFFNKYYIKLMMEALPNLEVLTYELVQPTNFRRTSETILRS